MNLFSRRRAGLAVLLIGAMTASVWGESRPNIVLVMTDDQGYGDVGIHGNEKIRTPQLDAFAENGVRLANFYCSPVCAPTRAALMTGRYFYRTGVLHTYRGGARMAADEETMAEVLQDACYVTGIFGKWHLGDNYPLRPQDQGFQHSLVHKSGGITQPPDQPNDYFDPLLWKDGYPVQAKGYCTDVFFGAALDFIEQNQRRPFFAYIATNAPHTPLIVDEAAWKRYHEAGLNEATAKVYAMVENIDTNFGRLLTKLDQLKLREKTLVIFMTDNGPQQDRFNGGLRGRKANVYEGGIRVPCFVQWPGTLEGGRTLEPRLAHIDWLPTLLDALGSEAELPHKLDGVSFWPLLTGTNAEREPRNLFFQVHRGLSPEPAHNAAVVGARYKLVMNAGSFSREKLKDVPEKDRSDIQLFDLKDDPGEQNNLAAMMPQQVDQMRKAYDAWFADVKGTRNFEPPSIVIGDAETESILLCRFQDAHYDGDRHLGWKVEVTRPILVELVLNQEARPKEKLMVEWLGNVQQWEIESPQKPTAVLQLAPGEGRLDVWLQAEGQPRVFLDNPSTQGDVVVKPVGD